MTKNKSQFSIYIFCPWTKKSHKLSLCKLAVVLRPYNLSKNSYGDCFRQGATKVILAPVQTFMKFVLIHFQLLYFCCKSFQHSIYQIFIVVYHTNHMFKGSNTNNLESLFLLILNTPLKFIYLTYYISVNFCPISKNLVPL